MRDSGIDFLKIETAELGRNSKKQVGRKGSNMSVRSSMSRQSRQRERDIEQAKKIVNEAENMLGYQRTFKEVDKEHEDNEKRVSDAVLKRPTELRPSVSRASARGGNRSPSSRSSARGGSRIDLPKINTDANVNNLLGIEF